MKTNAMKKPDFLDEVVEESGDDGEEYGAEIEEEGADDEEVGEDRLMAAKQVAKALGVPNADAQKLADALKALIKTCM